MYLNKKYIFKESYIMYQINAILLRFTTPELMIKATVQYPSSQAVRL